MKMNKYKSFITVLVVGLILVSCNQDLLEIEQQSVLDLDSYYSQADDEKAEALIASQYGNMRQQWGPGWVLGLHTPTGDFATGGGTVGDQEQYHQIRKYVGTITNSSYSSLYRTLYQFIRRSNLIIEKMPDDTETKKLIHAEAKAFRGWAMMYLIQLWGYPPFVPSTTTELKPSNGDRAEMWQWVEQQFDEASKVLPSKNGLGDQKRIGGRWTKEAALAYKAKAMLWQATGIPGAGIQGIPSKYGEAKTILKNIIDGGKYALWDGSQLSAAEREIIAKTGDPDNPYESLFRKYSNFCDENILENYVYQDNTSNYNAYGTGWDMFMGWRMGAGRYNGTLFSPTGGFGFGHITARFVEDLVEHDGDENSLRRKATVFTYNEWTALGNDVTSSYCENDGYIRKKYIVYLDDLNPYGVANNNYNVLLRNPVWMRYSELLLIYAEVCAATGDSDGSGLNALNQVRTRAGLPALGSYTLDDVKTEKRFELVIESDCRWIDVVRWGDGPTEFVGTGDTNPSFFGTLSVTPAAGESVIHPLYGGTHANSGLVSNVLVGINTDAQDFRAGKNELFPYSADELSSNSNLVQNPNW